MKFSLATRVYLGFVTLLLLSVTIAITDHFVLKKQEQVNASLNRTYQVINAAENVQGLLTDMETGRRGYRCTGEKKYLEPYYTAMQQIGPALTQLKDLVSNDAEQANNIIKLGNNVNDIILFWGKLRTGEYKYDSSQIGKITAEEKVKMDEIRAQTKNVFTAEHARQRAAEAENNKILAYSAWYSPVGSTLEQIFILTLIYLVIREFIRRRKAEAEMQKTMEKEKELSELKSRFVSMASHEFRTPLAAIQASAYLAAKYKSPEDQPRREKHFERIVSAVHTLTEILEDLLSVDKLEVGKVGVQLQQINVEEHIKAIVADFDVVLKPGQVIEYQHTGAATASLDPAILTRIISNLLSNAIKFSKENMIINITSNYAEGKLVITVRDNGIGIPKADLEHLFERFHRGGNVEAIGGTGLGLHIVHKYTTLMGGTITCNSQEDIGTEFTVTFPQTPISAKKEIPI